MKPIGHTILKKESVANSLDWARRELSNVEHGTVFLADEHVSTRGRQGRVWQQSDGQLLLTFVLKSGKIENAELKNPTLGMALALGFLQPLQKYSVGLKWPNDFMCVGKKVGGLIMQSVWHRNEVHGFIVGCAFNVNNLFSADDELSGIATSLKECTGRSVNAEILQEQLLVAADGAFHSWLAGDDDRIYEGWKKELIHLNRNIRAHLHDGTAISGILEDVRRDGSAVIVQDGNQIVVPFHTVNVVE